MKTGLYLYCVICENKYFVPFIMNTIQCECGSYEFRYSKKSKKIEDRINFDPKVKKACDKFFDLIIENKKNDNSL